MGCVLKHQSPPWHILVPISFGDPSGEVTASPTFYCESYFVGDTVSRRLLPVAVALFLVGGVAHHLVHYDPSEERGEGVRGDEGDMRGR